MIRKLQALVLSSVMAFGAMPAKAEISDFEVRVALILAMAGSCPFPLNVDKLSMFTIASDDGRVDIEQTTRDIQQATVLAVAQYTVASQAQKSAICDETKAFAEELRLTP